MSYIEKTTMGEEACIKMTKLIMAIGRNEAAHDDDLEETWNDMMKEYEETKKILYDYLEKRYL